MTDDLTQIQTIKSQTLATLAELAASPKPNYKIDNYELSWGEYQARLQEIVDWCDRKLKENEPYEFRSTARSF